MEHNKIIDEKFFFHISGVLKKFIIQVLKSVLYPYSSKQYSINSIDLLRVLLFLFSRSKHSFKTRIDSFKFDSSLFFISLT